MSYMSQQTAMAQLANAISTATDGDTEDASELLMDQGVVLTSNGLVIGADGVPYDDPSAVTATDATTTSLSGFGSYVYSGRGGRAR
jgi:hypothetical protein